MIGALLLASALAQEPTPPAPKRISAGIQYSKEIFGHVHQNPSRYSASLTTISCGHPIKVVTLKYPDGREESMVDGKWLPVSVGPYDGYVAADSLSEKRPDCFQDRYLKFFDAFGMELSELYYWGRLNDQYVTGKSRVR